ncbi:MAG: flagellin [SAR324 cluster bacterium]|nr:flagellin [SAR324 cluster bacterium]
MKIRQNTSSMNTLRHASNHFNKVKGSIERLSSGVKINSGADGPASLISSERLRGHIVGLQQVYNNASSSVSLLQTAEGALNEVSELLIKIKQLTIHAQNEATNSSDMLTADQQEIENLLSTIDRISQNTEFGGKKLLDGSMGANGTTVGNFLRFISAEATTSASPEQGWKVDIQQVATKAHRKGTKAININNIKQGLQIVLNEGGKNITLNTMEGQLGKDIEQLISNFEKNPLQFSQAEVSAQIRGLVVFELNQSIEDNGLDLQVSLSPADELLVRHNKFGESPSFSVTSSVPGVLSEKANIAQTAVSGKNIEGTINNEVALGEGQFLTALAGMETAGVTIMYDREISHKKIPILDDTGVRIGTELLEEKNEDLVGSPENPKTEGYVHVSQMSKEFQVGVNKKSNPSFSFANIRTDLMGNAVKNKSGFQSLADIDVTTTQGAKDAAIIVEKVIDEISTQRGKLGSFQKNTLESNLNSLKIAEENITQAESTLRDSDMAAEMSTLTQDQIMLQASTAMIAQANQVPKTVLGLIQNSG